jgi:type II secretory pathway pseudopilin PulG
VVLPVGDGQKVTVEVKPMRREANQSSRQPLHPRCAGQKRACRRGGRSYSGSTHENASCQKGSQRTHADELLVVIAVIVILAAMLLPTSGGPRRARVAICMNNQKQIALGFIMWKSDHGDQFPWQVLTTNNGTMESSDRGYAAPDFSAVADYIKNPDVFVCPTDEAKTEATNSAQLHNQNVSYFVALEAATNSAVSILTGDRHLQANGNQVKPGLFVYSNNFQMSRTRELHTKSYNAPCGVLSFADGHDEMVRGDHLNSVFQRQGMVFSRLAVP